MSTERVIKFRAWDEDRQVMVYEFHNKGWKNKYRILHTEEGHLICGNFMNNGDWQEPKLMQSTRLQDWSEPSQEIFEGDIVLCDGKQRTIKWSNGKFWFVAESSNYHEDISEMFGKYYGKVKRVGHIYSSPSSIEESKAPITKN
jgi:hypothetical protein